MTNFKILHTWNPDIDKFNNLVNQVDEFKFLKRDSKDSRFRLLNPLLLKNGDLVFHGNGTPLIKIDRCSNLIKINSHNEFHHSIVKDIDDNIWVSSYIYPQTLPIEKVGRGFRYQDGFLDDGIVQISPSGKILFEKSVSQILIDNGWEYLLFSVGDQLFTKDPIHLNDIQPVNFDGNFWKKGDIFLSLGQQSMVLLYRPLTNKIIWKGTGPFFHQHDINILDDHKISVFNNNSKDFVTGNFVDGNNELIIYNFKSNKYTNYLNQSLIKNDVRTITEGRSKIISNGDLFIEEQNFARILYLNKDGSLRWTYINSANNGKNYQLDWSRILDKYEDIQLINKFLQLKGKCNE